MYCTHHTVMTLSYLPVPSEEELPVAPGGGDGDLHVAPAAPAPVGTPGDGHGRGGGLRGQAAQVHAPTVVHAKPTLRTGA